MNRWLACSLAGTIAAFAAVSLTTAGCGGSVSNQSEGGTEGGSHPDHSSPVDSSTGKDVHPQKDAGKDTAINPFDAGDSGGDTGFVVPTEGGPTIPPGATQLVNTVDAGLSGLALLNFIGITDDGYVVYTALSGTTYPVYAVNVAGGAPIQILKDSGATGSYEPTIVHKTVFVLTAGTSIAATGNVVGTLNYWTKANGTQTAPGMSSGLVAASPDGTKVAYTTNVSADGSKGDIVAEKSDGTGKTTLLTATTTNGTATTTFFDPQIGFSNDTYFVATHEEPTDAGATSATVSFWDTATWTKTDLVKGAATTSGFGTPVLTSSSSWSSSTTGTGFGGTIVAATSAGALQAFVLPSATPIAVDTGVTSFTMKPDGSGVFYGTGSGPTGTYRVATLPTPGTPTTILTKGYGGFITGFSVTPAFSPDGNWSMYYTLAGSQTGEYDMNLVQSVASATPTSLLSAPTGCIFNDAFTADNAYTLYYTNFKAIGTTAAVGALNAYPVAGSKSISVSTNNVWNSYALSGSTIVYNDNYTLDTAGTSGYADIYTVDVSAATLAPKSLVMTADENFYLTVDKSKLVFSMSVGNTSTDGIWVMTP